MTAQSCIKRALTTVCQGARRSRVLLFLVFSCWTCETLSFQPPSRTFTTRSNVNRRNGVFHLETVQYQPQRLDLYMSSGSGGTNTTTTTVPSSTVEETSDLEAETTALTNVPPQQQNSSFFQDSDNLVFIMIGLCWGTAFLSALDRVAMSVAILPLSREFGYTDTVKGSIASLFSVGYGLAIIPCGLIVGSQSPRVVMAAGLALWSVATILTPLAAGEVSSMIPLLAARAAVGAAESAVLPTIQRLVSTWIPPSQKSIALAGIFSGFQAGTVAAYLLSPIVMDELGGWRGLFYTYGSVGLFWLIPWLLLSRDAPPTASLPENTLQKQQIQETESNSWQESMDWIKSAPWGDFAKSPAVWSMALAHAANSWGLYNNLAWTPTFYAEQYGLNVKDSALLSVLPSVAGAVGGLIAGSSADALLQKLKSDDDNEEMRTLVRKVYQGIALFGPAVCLATLSSHIPEQPWVAQTLLMGTVGLQAFNAAGYIAANQEKAGDKWTGLLYSITSLPGVMFGSLGVFLTGKILDLTQQDWSVVFELNAFVNLLGATAFVLLYNSKREFD